jgi:hypothetical protein
MRRFILGIVLALCALPALSQTFTPCPATAFTTNLNLSIPAVGTQNWNLCLNPNFQKIDAAIGQLQAPFQGAWVSTTVYPKGSYVTYGGSTYISVVNSNFNNTPSTGSSAWQFFFTPGASSWGGITGILSSQTDLQNALNAKVGWIVYSGTSAPSATCSSIANSGAIAVNATPTAYQCSNATGSYAWNTLGSSSSTPGGTTNSIQGQDGAGHLTGGPATVNSTTGAVSASVNTQLNVMMYGAVGDCSTDDHNAIVAACTAAQSYKLGNSTSAAVVFPKPPGGCYLTSTVQWGGCTMIGQPGAPGTNSPEAYTVAIKGKPGQDVLHVQDPSTASSAFTWNPGWKIQDITFIVDNSVAGSFPHRNPGRWFDDAGMTAGSAVLTTTNAQVQCGDIGQAVQVNGAGASGANLITTIANVAPCWAIGSSAPTWQVITLATAASTTVTNAHAYISLLGLPVTTRVGNCAIAMDDYDAKESDWAVPSQSVGSLYPIMLNVGFQQTNGNSNNSCGLYTQGQWGLYGLDVRDFNFFSSYFSVVQGTSELNSFQASNSGDFETWKHGLFTTTVYPWISYNGGEMRWEDVEVTALSGPQFLNLGNQWQDGFGSANLNSVEFESWNTPPTGAVGWRITGTGNTISAEIGATNMPGILDTNSATCNCFVGGGGLSVYGNNNVVNGMERGILVPTDGGRGNLIYGNYSASPFDGFQNSQNVAANYIKGHTDILRSIVPDFLRDGNPSVPYKWADLFMTPQDMLFPSSSPYSTYIVADATSPFGEDIILNPPGTSIAGVSQFQQYAYAGNANEGYLYIGVDMPAVPMTMQFMASCPTGTTFSIRGQSSNGYGVTQSFSCTTALAAYSIPLNFTGQTGYFSFQNEGTNAIHLAFVDLAPAVNLPAGSTIGGFGVGGSGAKIVTGQASGTTAGHIVTEVGTDGTVQDGGKPIGGAGAAAATTNSTTGTASGDLTCESDTVGTVRDCSGLNTLQYSDSTGPVNLNLIAGNGGAQISLRPSGDGQLAWVDYWYGETTDAWDAGVYDQGSAFVFYDHSQNFEPVIIKQGAPYAAVNVDSAGLHAGNGLSGNGNINLTTISSPTYTSANLTTASTGGTLANSTSYCYRVSATNAAGETLAGTEQCITTGSTGSNTNTATVNWLRAVGASGYRVYGRTTGAEQLMATISGSTFQFVDTGSVTPSGSLPASNTTIGSYQINGSTIIPGTVGGYTGNATSNILLSSTLPMTGATGSIGGSALAAGACTSGTVSVTGATTSMAVVATPVTYPGDGMAWRPYVSAAGTVTVKVCANIAGTPTASTYNVRVIQ